MNAFSDMLMRWQNFYILAGTAAATLAGLLFVTVSLHLNLIVDEQFAEARGLAQQTFITFLLIVVISLLFLVPGQTPGGLLTPLLFISLAGLVQEIRVGDAFRRRRKLPIQHMPASYLIRRIMWPSVSYMLIPIVAISINAGDSSALYWMIAPIILLLTSAAGNSWDMLVRLAKTRPAEDKEKFPQVDS